MKPWKVRERYLGEVVRPPRSNDKGMRPNPQPKKPNRKVVEKMERRQAKHGIDYGF